MPQGKETNRYIRPDFFAIDEEGLLLSEAPVTLPETIDLISKYRFYHHCRGWGRDNDIEDEQTWMKLVPSTAIIADRASRCLAGTVCRKICPLFSNFILKQSLNQLI